MPAPPEGSEPAIVSAMRAIAFQSIGCHAAAAYSQAIPKMEKRGAATNAIGSPGILVWNRAMMCRQERGQTLLFSSGGAVPLFLI